MEANRDQVIVDALDWALKHVVRPRDTVVVLTLPLLKNGSLTELMDPRLKDASNTQAVHHMAEAALLCLNDDSGHRFSISEEEHLIFMSAYFATETCKFLEEFYHLRMKKEG